MNNLKIKPVIKAATYHFKVPNDKKVYLVSLTLREKTKAIKGLVVARGKGAEEVLFGFSPTKYRSVNERAAEDLLIRTLEEKEVKQ